jgi:hypothetical protein
LLFENGRVSHGHSISALIRSMQVYLHNVSVSSLT